jgi:hypothetical protein
MGSGPNLIGGQKSFLSERLLNFGMLFWAEF